MSCFSDVVIVGGGPAGLSAAINAASEGLTVTIIDSAPILGGQARESNAIENYLGFPDGVTGEQLMSSAILQARKFGNLTIVCPASVLDIERGADGGIEVTTEDYGTYFGKTVILANGLSYRRLQAENIGALMGRGVWYGLPPSALPPERECRVAIVGGANSAGQAAMKIAENTNAQIKMYIRKKLDTQMSHYLVDRIRKANNIEVCEGCEVKRVDGGQWLQSIDYTQRGESVATDPELIEDHPTDFMFIFIGAQPRTLWLKGKVDLDEGNYIKTGGGVRRKDKAAPVPLFFETSMLGVFAAGDVRAYSTKRIAAAIGEGSAVVAQVHQYLARGG